VPARGVEDGVAGPEAEQRHHVVGVPVTELVGQHAGVEVEVVLAERRVEVEGHDQMMLPTANSHLRRSQ